MSAKVSEAGLLTVWRDCGFVMATASLVCDARGRLLYD